MSESAGQHSGWLLDTEVRGEGEVQGDLGVVGMIIVISAANRLIGEVVQSRRRPLLGPSPG